jgi:hypothetical protein
MNLCLRPHLSDRHCSKALYGLVLLWRPTGLTKHDARASISWTLLSRLKVIGLNAWPLKVAARAFVQVSSEFSMVDFSRFPAPWHCFELEDAFLVRDAAGSEIACIYFDREPSDKGRITQRPMHDEAHRIALNIARLPELLGAAGHKK